MNGLPWWAALVVPLLTALLAIIGAWIAVTFDRKKSVNQELIKKRIAIYDQVAPKLNDLFCFFCSVGAWRSLTPPAMLNHKGDLDRIIHVYAALFSPELFRRYQSFNGTIFKTSTGMGEPVKLRASRARLKIERGVDWDNEWDAVFADRDSLGTVKAVESAYAALMGQFAIELGTFRRQPAVPGERSWFLSLQRWMKSSAPHGHRAIKRGGDSPRSK